jgi:hypothetical protein
MFRKDGALEATLGAVCSMRRFWDCDFKGPITSNEKDEAQLESIVEEKAAFSMSGDSYESSQSQSWFPRWFHSQGNSSGTSVLTVEGTVSFINNERAIIQMINKDETVLDWLFDMAEPHIVTAIIKTQKFEDKTSFSGEGEYGASNDAIKAVTKAGVAVGAAAATGGASAIPGAIFGQVISGKKLKVKSAVNKRKMKKVVGGEAHRLAKAPKRPSAQAQKRPAPDEDVLRRGAPGRARPEVRGELSVLVEVPPGVDDGIAGKNRAQGKAHVKLGAGSVVGYEVSKVVFEQELRRTKVLGEILGDEVFHPVKRILRLERNEPRCYAGDAPCWLKKQLNWAKTRELLSEAPE